MKMGRLKLARALSLTKSAAFVATTLGLVVKVFMPFTRWRLRNIPGYAFTPLFGDGLKMLKQQMIPFLQRLCTTHSNSPFIKVWMPAGGYSIVVRDPRLALHLMNLVSTKDDFHLAKWAPERERQAIDNVLLFINGHKWEKSRTAMGAVSRVNALKAHVPVMQKHVERLVVTLDRVSMSDSPVNIHAYCLELAQAINNQVLFEVDMQRCGPIWMQKRPEAVMQSALSALHTGVKAADTALLPPDKLEDKWWEMYPLGSPEFEKRLLSCSTQLFTFVYRIPTAQTLCMLCPRLSPVWRRLAYIIPDKTAKEHRKVIQGLVEGCGVMIDDWKAQQHNSLITAAPRQWNGLVGHIFSQEDSFDENELVGTLMTASVAGFETTASLLAMCLYFCSKYPATQKQAQQEVDRVLGGRVPSLTDLKDLPYLQAVIHEVLRLSPSVAIGLRCLKDTHYVHPDTNIRLPKGTNLWFPFNAYNRDPTVWPRAEEFLPERHIQPGHEHLAPTYPEVFLPFGAGIRKCPGWKFAMQESRLALVRLLQEFEFRRTPECPEPWVRSRAVASADQVMLKVVKRGKC